MDAGDGDPATFFHYLGQASAHADDAEHTPLPKLTPVYSSQLAELIQPTSLPPPVSAVASFIVEFCAAYCDAVTVIVPEPPPVDVPLGIFHCC